jgi:hypothetical protein
MAAFITDQVLLGLGQFGIYTFLTDGLTVQLFDNNYTVTQDLTFGVLTQATFDGYAGVPLTSYLDAGVVAHVQSWKFNPVAVFTAGAGIVSTVLYGYMVYSATNGFYFMADNFPVPITFDTPGQTIVIPVSYSIQDKKTV